MPPLRFSQVKGAITLTFAKALGPLASLLLGGVVASLKDRWVLDGLGEFGGALRRGVLMFARLGGLP